ncbi:MULTISPECIES: MipA/OmpV family protein [Thalassospira]|nr:MipA/OmpV family protein [Thalassospira profundimaris]
MSENYVLHRAGNSMLFAGVTLCLTALLILFMSPAQAQQAKKETLRDQVNPKTGDALDPWFGGNWQVGAFGGVSNNPYRGTDDVELGLLPIVAYDSERMHIGVDGIDIKFFKNDVFSASVIGALRMEPFDNGDGNYLRGMEERDMAFEAGIGFSADIWRGSLITNYLTDVNDAHDGHQVDMSYVVPEQWGDVGFSWGGGVTWQSDKLVDYMVGVRRKEVRSDRAYYAPDAAFIPHIDFTVTYPLTEQIMLIGTHGFQYLPDQYTDSPIIDEDYVFSAGIGLVYSF